LKTTTIHPKAFSIQAKPDDPRLIEEVQFISIEELKPANAKWSYCLIGVPDDRGIQNGGGRKGAALAPSQVRKFLYKMTPPPHLEPRLPKQATLIDLGDLVIDSSSLEKTHQDLASLIQKVHENGHIPIVIGGGHDHAYAEILGAALSMKNHSLSMLNLDAHLDVRPVQSGVISSGTPFWRALNDPDCKLKPKNYHVYGIQPHCNSTVHYTSLKNQGGTPLSLLEIEKKGGIVKVLSKRLLNHWKRKLPTLFNLDLDSIRISDCPGTSAPQIEGFSASEVIRIARKLLRKNSIIRSIGIYEASPPLDRDDQTSRLAALFIYNVIF